MWTAIHVIDGNNNANRIKDKLTQEGFLVRVKIFAKEEEKEIYKILVPEFEAQEASNVLIELGY